MEENEVYIFIPWFYPAYRAGGPVQSIANMVEQFHENLTYKIFCGNKDLGNTLLDVEPDKWLTYNNHLQVYYASKANSLSYIHKEIKRTRPRVIFINGIYSWRFNLYPLLFFNAPRKIVSARGMLHPGALSQKAFKKKIYLFLWKTLGLYKKCDFHASTLQEKSFIENVFGNVKVFVAKNFPKVIPRLSIPPKVPGSLQMISVALISPMKNHLLVIKSLHNCRGHITYNIYGPVKQQDYWELCLQEIKKLPGNIHIKYHGDIAPGEVPGVLAKNHVFILPSKSENFGHALYEALSAGRPVITSTNTPWNNLRETTAGINVNIEDVSTISNAVNLFVDMNETEFDNWGKSANEYALTSVNINEIREEYSQMFHG